MQLPNPIVTGGYRQEVTSVGACPVDFISRVWGERGMLRRGTYFIGVEDFICLVLVRAEL